MTSMLLYQPPWGRFPPNLEHWYLADDLSVYSNVYVYGYCSIEFLNFVKLLREVHTSLHHNGIWEVLYPTQEGTYPTRGEREVLGAERLIGVYTMHNLSKYVHVTTKGS